MSWRLALVLGGLLLASPAPGAINQWSGTGPEGGLVDTIAADPSTPTRLFAGGAGGVYRSNNGGASWARLTLPGLCAVPIPFVAIDPQTPTTVYAATSCGFFRSHDGGDTWTRSADEVGSRLATVAIDPVTPAVLWGGGANQALVAEGPIAVSRDGGATWQALGPQGLVVPGLAVAPTTPRRVLAAARTAGVLVSADDGATWTPGTGLAGADLNMVAVDPNDPMRAYAAGYGAVFTSDDAGASWTAAPVAGWQLVVLPTRPTSIYGVGGATVFRSLDAGGHWEEQYVSLPGSWFGDMRVLAATTGGPPDLYVAPVGGGVLRGRFGDDAFTPVNTGLVQTWINAVATDPHVAGTVYAASIFEGALKSTDGGLTWTRLTTPTDDVRLWAIAPGQPTTIYAGGLSSVARSTDGAAHWSAAVRPEREPSPNALTLLIVDPRVPDVVYASVNARGVYRSTNGGASWELANEGLPVDERGNRFVGQLEIDPFDPATLWAIVNEYQGGVFSTERVYRSTDGAAHWREVPIPGVAFPSPLALDPHTPGRVYVFGYAGGGIVVATSDDAGNSWTLVTVETAGKVQQLIVDPFDPDRLWGRTYNDVLVSRDRGRHWHALRRGLPSSDPGAPARIESLALDPVRPQVAYAGLLGNGVLVYDDRCGNGRLDAFEECDDGNGAAGDGCRPQCEVERPGDGVLDPGEECDDANLASGDGCDANMTFGRCGNGIVTGGEQCDDGNENPDDGCANCRTRCLADAECDDGNACTNDFCSVGTCLHEQPTDVHVNVRCASAALDGTPLCPGEAVPAGFVLRLGRLADRLARLADADDATMAASRRRVLGRLRHLSRRAGHLPPAVSRACARQLRQAVRQTMFQLAAGWPP